MSETGRLGKYEIIEEIGRGGFAIVYRALDTTLDREVALKVLNPLLLQDSVWVRRFYREAKAVARLQHSNIVTIFEIGKEQGQMFIAMELIRGPSLQDLIAERGSLTWNQTLHILVQIADALDYAHEEGIVHRDIKPSNILIHPRRGALLTDFGLARLVSESSMSATVSGGIVGTPSYIAPEIWDKGIAEAPADVYALGCIVYEMLTGEVLFEGATPLQTMRAHDKGPQFPAQWPEGVPSGVESVLRKALAHVPADRFANTGEMEKALRQMTDVAPVPGRVIPLGWIVAIGVFAVAGVLCAVMLGTALMNGDWLAALLQPATPTPTWAPTATPTTTPTLTPMPPSPVETVEHYYESLNSGEYSEAWEMFTLHYQQSQPAKDLQEYEVWAITNIKKVVLVTPIVVLEQSDSQATVQIARALYYMQNDTIREYNNFRICLKWEASSHEWLIDDVDSDCR